MNVLDSFSLAGRTAVITGANRGIGRALALALAQAGADVATLVRDPSGAAETLAEIRDTGRRASAHAADVTDRPSLRRAREEVLAEYGRVDVLVNNAGACIHRPAFEVTDDEFDHVVDINLGGVFKASQVFGEAMAEAGGGSIVNIGSISAQIVNRPQWQPAYNASKAGVHQLTKSLAAEWAPHRIRVNAIAPGYVKTEMAPVDDPAYKPRWIDDAAQQRYALPAEIGPTLIYAASDASAFMTGSVIVIDGGYTLF